MGGGACTTLPTLGVKAQVNQLLEIPPLSSSLPK